MKRRSILPRIVALWLSLALGLPAWAVPRPEESSLRPMSGEGAGLEELGNALEGPRIPEREFLRGVARELRSRLEPSARHALDVLDAVERRLLEADKDPAIDVRQIWVPFREAVRECAVEWQDTEMDRGTLQRFAETVDPAWSRRPEWGRYAEYFRYSVQEVFQRVYGLALTMTDEEILPGEDLPRSDFERNVYARAARQELTELLDEMIPKLEAAEVIPPVRTALSDEEWTRLMDLQEEMWLYFAPLGNQGLPMMFLTEVSGFFQPTRLRVAVELMKDAGVGPSSHVWDMGAGVGHICVAAAEVLGARATGVEVNSQLAAAGRDLLDYLVDLGLIGESQAEIRQGDMFAVRPEPGVTHLTAYPSLLEGLRERLDNWMVSDSGVAPGTRFVLLRTDEGDPEEVRELWPALSARWSMTPHWPQGVVFEKPPASGLEEAAPATLYRTLHHSIGQVLDVAVSPDGRRIASAGSGPVRVWDSATGRLLRKLDARGAGRHSQVAFGADGRVGSMDENGIVRVWNADTGALLSEVSLRDKGRARDPAEVFVRLHFMPDGKAMVLMADGNSIRLLDAERGLPRAVLHRFTGNELLAANHRVHNAVFSADGGTLVTIADHGSEEAATGSDIRVWDLRRRSLVRRITDPEIPVACVDLSPDGRYLATGDGDHAIRLWDLSGSEPVRVLALHDRSVDSVAFSPDGRWVASGGTLGQMIVTGTAPGSVPRAQKAHLGRVNGLAFDSSSGFLLVSGSGDGEVKLWGPETSVLEREGSFRDAGLAGGRETLEWLVSGLGDAETGTLPDRLISVLAASSHPDRPAPLHSGQWADFLRAFLRVTADPDAVSPLWLERFERSFFEALQLEGDPLDPQEFSQPARELMSGIWMGLPENMRALLEPLLEGLSPKDQLAHLLWGWSLRIRFSGTDPFVSHVVFQWTMRRGAHYPDMARVYELLHLYPEQTGRALFRAADTVQALPRKDQLPYWKAFEEWLLRMAVMQPSCQALGFEAQFMRQMDPEADGGIWHATPEAFRASLDALEGGIIALAVQVLRLELDPALPVPFVDERIPEPLRDRFIRALIYQVEHRGETMRAVLAAYFRQIQGDPGDAARAIEAAEAAALTLTPEEHRPDPAFMAGPAPMLLVVQPVEERVDLTEDIQARWGAFLVLMREFSGREDLSEEIRGELSGALVRFEEGGVPRRAPASAREMAWGPLQRAVESGRGDGRRRIEGQVEKVRQAFRQVESLLKKERQQKRPILVRMRLLKDPVRRYQFCDGSTSCLNSESGLFRDYAQGYGTNPRLQIPQSEEVGKPDPARPQSRLTVYQAADGSIVAVNGLDAPADYQFLPAYAVFMEEYARVVGAPACLPKKFFPDSPGPGWEETEVSLTLPEGPDRSFHMDLTGGMAVPADVRSVKVWRYAPPSEAPVQFREARRSGRLNTLLQMMDRFLRAQHAAQVEGAFLEAVRGILGYSGPALYRVDARGRIRSSIRAMEGDTRSADWTEPQGEQREALERFRRGEGSLHILNRFDPAEAPYVDPDLLETDRQRYPGGNVGEVYYVTLADARMNPWGLLMVNRWAGGEPLFPGGGTGRSPEENKETVRGVLQALGNAALLALEGARDIEETMGYMGLQGRSSEIAGRLGALTRDLRALSQSAGLTAQQISDFEGLGGEVAGLARELEDSARTTMEIVRERRERPAARRGEALIPAPVTNLNTLEHLFGDLSLTLLGAVAERDTILLSRARENFEALDFPEGSIEREVAEEWIALAASAIEARNRMEEENRTLRGRLDHLRERLGVLEGLRLRVDGMEAADHVAQEISQVAASIREFLAQIESHDAESQAGLEETPGEIPEDLLRLHQMAHDASQIQLDNLALMRAGGEPDWNDFERIMADAQGIRGAAPRAEMDEERRDVLDNLAIVRMHSVMIRATDPALRMGQDISDDTAAALDQVMGEGNRLLKLEPLASPGNISIIRFLQAEAAKQLWSSGKFSDPDGARHLITDRRIPATESFRMLQEVEMHFVTKMQRVEPQTDKLNREIGRGYFRAMAYGLLRIVTHPSPDSAAGEASQEVMDALAVFMDGGLEVGDIEGILELRRASIQRVIELYLRDMAGGRTGHIPDSMVQEALQGDEAALLELARLSCGILSIVSGEDSRETFRDRYDLLWQELLELDPLYADRYAGRVRLQSPPPDRELWEGALPYPAAIRLVSGVDVASIPTFYEVESDILPGQYVLVPQQGVLIPFGHFAWEAGGFRVVDQGAVGSYLGPGQVAGWFIGLGGQPGMTLVESVWQVYQDDRPGAPEPDEVVTSDDGLMAGGISLRVIPDVGVLVQPRETGKIWMERIPGEMEFESPFQRGLFGLLTERMRRARDASSGDPLLSLLDRGVMCFQDPEAGLEILRGPGRLVKLEQGRGVAGLFEVPWTGAGAPQDEILLEGLAGTGVLLRRGEEGWEAVPGGDAAQASESPYHLTASLTAVLARNRWSKARVEAIVGPLEAGVVAWEHPLKMTDGSRTSMVTFKVGFSGELILEVAREPALETQETLRLLLRLVVILAEPPGDLADPAFTRQTPLEELRGETAGSEMDGAPYLRRYLAVETLLGHPDPEALVILLDRLKPEAGGGEAAPTIRQRIVEGLVERHQRFRYTPAERYEVWKGMASLLTHSERRDPNPFVRRVAIQAFARLMPEGEEAFKALTPFGGDWRETRSETFALAVETLRLVRDNDRDPAMKELSEWLTGVLGRQRREGTGLPISVAAGAWEFGSRSSGPGAGLEEMTVEEFAGRSPASAERIPEGATRAWVAPLPHRVSVYGQGPGMAAGLEERFRRAPVPGLNVEVYEAPLPAGREYGQPGLIVEDSAFGAGIENPRQLLVIRLWLSDLEKVNPAALVLAALGALQNPDVKILGAMVYTDAQGRASLVVFA